MKDPRFEKQYVKTGKGCPFCGPDANVDGDNVEVDDVYASQEVACTTCGAEWTDIYRLVSINPTYVSEEA